MSVMKVALAGDALGNYIFGLDPQLLIDSLITLIAMFALSCFCHICSLYRQETYCKSDRMASVNRWKRLQKKRVMRSLLKQNMKASLKTWTRRQKKSLRRHVKKR